MSNAVLAQKALKADNYWDNHSTVTIGAAALNKKYRNLSSEVEELDSVNLCTLWFCEHLTIGNRLSSGQVNLNDKSRGDPSWCDQGGISSPGLKAHLIPVQESKTQQMSALCTPPTSTYILHTRSLAHASMERLECCDHGRGMRHRKLSGKHKLSSSSSGSHREKLSTADLFFGSDSQGHSGIGIFFL